MNAAERQKRWFFYGQDTWRISTEAHLQLRPALGNLRSPNSVNGEGQRRFRESRRRCDPRRRRRPDRPQRQHQQHLKAFAPRIGVAYQFDSKTVVRLGYGRSFDIGVFGSNFGHVVTQNLPVLAQQSDSDTNAGSRQLRTSALPSSPWRRAAGVQFRCVLSGISPGRHAAATWSDGTSAREFGQRFSGCRLSMPGTQPSSAKSRRTMSVEVAYIGNKGTHVRSTPTVHLTIPTRSQSAPAPTSSLARPRQPALRAASLRSYRNRIAVVCFQTAFRALSGYTRHWVLRAVLRGHLSYFGNDASSNYEALAGEGREALLSRAPVPGATTLMARERFQPTTTTPSIPARVRSGSLQPPPRLRDQHRLRTAVRPEARRS